MDVKYGTWLTKLLYIAPVINTIVNVGTIPTTIILVHESEPKLTIALSLGTTSSIFFTIICLQGH